MKLRRLLVLAWLAMACTHAPPVHPSSLYRANTRARLESVADFALLCPDQANQLQSVKFVIGDFQDAHRFVRFLDGHFYRFHDEWFWYQVLNGIAVADAQPFRGPGFASPTDATRWARQQDTLPNALTFTNERLYSTRFYESAISKERAFGVGAIVRIPANASRAAIWGFELEHADLPTREQVETFYTTLRAVLPNEIAHDLRWLTRSEAQAKLGAGMRGAGSAVPVLDYSQLSSVGESEVYSSGLGVGRLRLLRSTDSAIEQASERSMIVAPRPLDDLPPAAGLVSLVPLTPLSHFNVLARQRGIPCAYVGGLQSDPYISSLIKAQAPVLLDARASGVKLAVLSEAEFLELSIANHGEPPRLQASDVTKLPYVRTLDELARDPLRASLGELGGKMLGFVALAQLGQNDRPEPVLAIGVRAYAEHVAPLVPTLRKLIQEPSFRRWPRLRLLALEGPKRFAQEFPAQSDRAWAKSIEAGTGIVSEVVRQGGVQAMIRARPIAATTLQVIREQLGRSMSGISRAQGLRFRSSSTVEDIEGWSGAGLYDSSTGFLDASGKHSVESAIKRTWASYWTYRGYEERTRARIDSLAGRMAVVVHPRFDDDLELANAVVTYTLFPPDHAELARMDVNAQIGALSITNPPVDKPNALPEVTRVVSMRAASRPQITRIRSSTEVADQHGAVFGDAALFEVFAKLTPLATYWLTQHNARLDAHARARMTTLDLELRLMAATWPMGAPAHSAPRWIIKQVRSLEPAALLTTIAELPLPIPRDVFARSVRIIRRNCESVTRKVELIEAYTGADFDPDIGYARTPFIASIGVRDGQHAFTFTHLDLASVTETAAHRIELTSAAAAKLGAATVDLGHMRCSEEVIGVAHSELLRRIAERAKALGRPRTPAP